MRPFGNPEELERRRFRAVELMDRGEDRATICRILGVTRGSLSRWKKAARLGTLAAKPNPGRTALLSDADLRELRRLLEEGAVAHGWHNEFWTSRRVCELIRRRFGVSYNPAHVTRILRERLDWTPQRPEQRHIKRDDAAIHAWVQGTFRAVARASERRDAELVFIDEAGFMLEPTVRRTYAPRGQTPVLCVSGPHQRISVIAALSIRPKTGRVRLEYGLLADNLNFRWQTVLEFVRRLRSRIGRPAVLIWDQIAIHTCEALKEKLSEVPGVTAEPFPPYASELNPADGVWRYIKNNRLPNFTPPGLGELRVRLTDELELVRGRPELLRGFVRYTNLPIPRIG
jgi:transposase